MLLFILKKLIGLFCMPLSLTFIFLAAGMIMLMFSRKQIAARVALITGFLLLLLFSYGFLSSWPLEELESEYRPFDVRTSGSDYRWVVVLAGDKNESMIRLVEGIRIQKAISGSKLIVSGGRIFSPVSSAEIMADTARGIGVDPAAIVLEDQSKDTKDEARIIKGMVKNEPFVLVTSAYHMPRSMALFRGQGLNPAPAPTQYMTAGEQRVDPWMFFPSARNIYAAEVVIHEILGLAAAGIMGQIE